VDDSDQSPGCHACRANFVAQADMVRPLTGFAGSSGSPALINMLRLQVEGRNSSLAESRTVTASDSDIAAWPFKITRQLGLRSPLCDPGACISAGPLGPPSSGAGTTVLIPFCQSVTVPRQHSGCQAAPLPSHVRDSDRGTVARRPHGRKGLGT
jgi:hypothetical protein